MNYRIDGLTAENRSLRASIAEYKAKEERIGKALVGAEEKGEEICEFYRASAELEWKSLRLFADKWKNLAAQMSEEYPKESRRYFRFAEDLAALLGREEGRFAKKEKQDSAVGTEEKTFDPQAVIGKYVEGEEESNGFNLDDVLNPKGDLDLEKLCRSLGLMDDD